ncbi:MAG TPA: GNAT family N-acetyltransferase [Gemmatimonadaceae bacterium]|nr:GNAT family N-acetyltransferase [Gemmatimonadaceae bacterium]
MPRISVTRTYLEMRSPDALRSYHADDSHVRFERVYGCPVSFFRYLYREVGRPHHWVDRLSWTDEQVSARLANDAVSLWVMYVDGAPAGYAELERHHDDSTEIVYFGLLPEFTRRGLGKLMLTAAVERAWEQGTSRVWLHTCTLDDPAALPNYLKRGFAAYKEELYTVEIDEPELATLRSATPAT